MTYFLSRNLPTHFHVMHYIYKINTHILRRIPPPSSAMYRRLQESVTRGDVPALRELIQLDEKSVEHATFGPHNNTILHVAAMFGHADYAAEVVGAWPEMAAAENAELETPLHHACRQGHLEIAKLLLEIDPWAAYKVNSRNESAFYAACERGRVLVVRHLAASFPGLLMLDMDMEATSLHVAASSGNIEIVKEIVKQRPDFAWRKNHHGCTPLHLACSKGHLEITRELVKLDSDLCLIPDGGGRTPLHCAAIKGRINIIDEILSLSLDLFEATTNNGETALHLAVKNNQYEVVKYLTESLNITKLLNMQENDGNTALHLATAGKLTAMVIYLLKIGIEVNCLNGKGYTALDVVESDASNSGALLIVPALLEAGAKRCDQLSPGLADIPHLAEPGSRRFGEASRMRSPLPPWPNAGRTPRNRGCKNRHRASKLELQNEGLRNARKTVTIVAVLIATVTFAAGINPPGGFSQGTGKALRGDRAAFKAFMVCNIAALFLSVGVVNVLVSIIPITRRTMMRLMSATHKVMWLSTLFMTAAYIAAVWTIMPEDRGARWVSVELVVFGGGCSAVVFSGLAWLLVRHWRNKYLWRKAKIKRIKEESPHSSVSRVDELKIMRRSHDNSSTNSDVDSSDHGYHLY
ncbi:ankyrin repeat-containing protein At5g02620-like [Salvia miltiorrhiza]|uniref:ankyrin repeat-containing protein At5g02620-like n=1 Tax=Salvia miltiorrhiza TaxID=226208 RepID=UPI0025AC7BA8|nr:ankyrin repeat-containing protein At5g02620-like [Salvia miltiorrhiza]